MSLLDISLWLAVFSLVEHNNQHLKECRFNLAHGFRGFGLSGSKLEYHAERAGWNKDASFMVARNTAGKQYQRGRVEEPGIVPKVTAL